MTDFIIVGLVAGLISAYGTHLLLTEKERRDYEKYQDSLTDILDRCERTEIASANAVRVASVMAGTIKHNRDELDEWIPEFQRMKRWMYEYVSYRPAIVGKKYQK